MWTSTTGGSYHGGYTYGPGPWVDAYRTADGAIVHRGYTYDPDKSAFTVEVPDMWPKISKDEFEKRVRLELDDEEEKPLMKTYSERDHISNGRKYAVACSHPLDLEQDRILKSISAMKGKLMMQCAPVKLVNVECRMTPAVKHNIIMAYKKLEMYGKKTPFVARFDEFGRRLSDEVKLDTMKGMTIKIVDPVEYGTHYLEFQGVVRDLFYSDKDIPF